MRIVRYILAAVLVPATLAAQEPLKHAPRPTTPAISEADLRTRVYIFADDSMGGREAGTVGHVKSTAYIEAELKRLGLQPAGEGGTYFQSVPLVERSVGPQSGFSIGGRALTVWDEFVPLDPRRPSRSFTNAEVVFAGPMGDTSALTTRELANGRVLVFHHTPGRGQVMIPFMRPGERFENAAGAIVVTTEQVARAYANFARSPAILTPIPDTGAVPAVFMLPEAAATALFSEPLGSLAAGAIGSRVTGTVQHAQEPIPARNVVAVMPGSDARLRGQYVALGAHSDHDGFARAAVDHDSLRAFNAVVRPSGADMRPRAPTEDEQARIGAMLDSLRRVNPPRRDSIYNGADDDASGSMALLEIAEALALGRDKPRRSVLFVWHTAEEKGLVGANYFSRNPTVPLDSIVAQLNLDMVGRGNPDDVPHSAPGELQLLGSRRLSTRLGDLVEETNNRQPRPFKLDYSFDAPGHPQRYYCRSDHYMYARFGIPVTFFSTGGHRDYHMVTDEPQYLNYPQLTAVTRLVHDVTLAVANQDERLVVDMPKPDPFGPCVQ